MRYMHKVNLYLIAIIVFLIVPKPGGEYLSLPILPVGMVTVLVIIATFFVLFEVLQSKKVKPIPVFLWVILFFILWIGVSFSWSISPQETLLYTFDMFTKMLFAWLIWQTCRNSKDVNLLMQVYVLGAFIGSSFILINNAGDISSIFRLDFYGRSATAYGAIISLGLPMAWHLSILSKKLAMKIINISYIPISLIILFFLGARGPVIAAFGGLVIIFLAYYVPKIKNVIFGLIQNIVLNRRTLFRRFSVMFFVAMVFIILIVTPFGNTLNLSGIQKPIDRLMTIPQEFSSEGDIGVRRVLWETALVDFTGREVIGRGGGTFLPHIQEVRRTSGAGSHNAFIQALVETGIVGFLLYACAFLILFISILKQKSFEKYFFLGMLIVLFLNLNSLSWINENSKWIILSISLLPGTYVYRNKKIIYSTLYDMKNNNRH